MDVRPPHRVFVAVLFILPLLLVLKMSGSDWPLLSGDQGINFPPNFSKAVTLEYFWPSVWFTLKYTS